MPMEPRAFQDFLDLAPGRLNTAEADIAALKAGGGGSSGVSSYNGRTGAVTTQASDRNGLGLGSLALLSSVNDGNWSGADLSIANGGTGASSASAARDALGLTIGTNVQAWGATLDALSPLVTTVFGRDYLTVADAAGARTKAGLGTAAVLNTGVTQGTIPLIGAGGKLDAALMPAIAITDTFVVASQSEQTALTAQRGDVAIRTDLNKSFILKGDDPTNFANWEELRAPAGGGGSSGTVTTVSVTTANGVSGTVANASTTPAITLTLGAITPSSVAATGNVTGANLSGTNTGDQTITLTGDVTGSGTGSFAATVAARAVTPAKQSAVASGRFKGRISAGTGDEEDLTGTQATTLLDVVTTAGKGLVPVLPGNTTTFFRGDGTFAAPPSGGGSALREQTLRASGGSATQSTTYDIYYAATAQTVTLMPRQGTGSTPTLAYAIAPNPGSGSPSYGSAVSLTLGTDVAGVSLNAGDMLRIVNSAGSTNSLGIVHVRQTG